MNDVQDSAADTRQKGPAAINPIAADKASEDRECGYCGDGAEWLVEAETVSQYVSFFVCRECSKDEKIWVEENELTKNDVSEELAE